ncbi:acyl-CoA dehydrogenase middle domain-containing protein [Pseudomonas sp. X10]
MAWLQRLNDPLRQPLAASLGETYAALLERLGAVSPFELAVLGGRAMPTPGLAFLIGYQAALRVLWPSAPASLGALCATERRSVRPADMGVRLDGLRLTGSKDFVTAGLEAEWLLVAARSEEQGETPRLSLAVVYPGEPGVRVEALPALPLMPEVGHAHLHLEQAVCELLAGDGWDAYVKPFRSLEDLYVLAALVAWLYSVGQQCAWPQALQLRLLGLLGGCAEGSRQCADSVGCHLLLGGLFAQFQGLRGEIDQALAAGPEEWASLWQRDQGVLDLASTAREKRLAKAWTSAGLS